MSEIYEPFFYIPAPIDASMPPEVVLESLGSMYTRSQAIDDFLRGEISPEDFQDVLSDTGVNPYIVGEAWEQGISYGTS